MSSAVLVRKRSPAVIPGAAQREAVCCRPGTQDHGQQESVWFVFLDPGARFARPGRQKTSKEAHGQISPIRVSFFDQFNLPGSSPSLDSLFRNDRILGLLKLFHEYEPIHAITLGESAKVPRLVFRNTLGEP